MVRKVSRSRKVRKQLSGEAEAKLQNSVVIVAIDERDPSHRGGEIVKSLSDLSLTMDSSGEEVLNSIQSMVLEEYGIDMKNSSGSWRFKVQKKSERNMIYVIPNATAG